MFTVILHDQALTELDRTSLASNEDYLIQRDQKQYGLLSRLNKFDVDVFCSGGMDELVAELYRLRGALSTADDLAHIDRITDMARVCKRIRGATLMFNPYNV